MSDREILDEYVDLDKSCLSGIEKKQVMDMLYKYKDTLSFRDEIGTCRIKLHWLPVRVHIQYKILLLVYKCVQRTAPTYLQELISQYF